MLPRIRKHLKITGVLTAMVFMTMALLVMNAGAAHAMSLTDICNGSGPGGNGSGFNQTQTVSGLSTPFNRMLQPLMTVSQAIFLAANRIAKFLFMSLAVVQVTWFMLEVGIWKSSIEDFLQKFGVKVIGILIAFSLIMSITADQGKFIRGLVLNDFSNVGSYIGGQIGGASTGGLATSIPNVTGTNGANNGGDNLAQIVGQGACIAYALAQYPSDKYYHDHASQYVNNQLNPLQVAADIWTSVQSIVPEIYAVLISALVILVYVFLVLKMLALLIDALIGLAAGTLLLGLSGFGQTWGGGLSIGRGYVMNVIKIGAEALAINMIAGFGVGLMFTSGGAAIGSAMDVLDKPSLPYSVLNTTLIYVILIGLMALHANKIAHTIASGEALSGVGAHAVEAAVGTAAAGGAMIAMGGASLGGGIKTALANRGNGKNTQLPGGSDTMSAAPGVGGSEGTMGDGSTPAARGASEGSTGGAASIQSAKSEGNNSSTSSSSNSGSSSDGANVPPAPKKKSGSASGGGVMRTVAQAMQIGSAIGGATHYQGNSSGRRSAIAALTGIAASGLSGRQNGANGGAGPSDSNGGNNGGPSSSNNESSEDDGSSGDNGSGNNGGGNQQSAPTPLTQNSEGSKIGQAVARSAAVASFVTSAVSYKDQQGRNNGVKQNLSNLIETLAPSPQSPQSENEPKNKDSKKPNGDGGSSKTIPSENSNSK